MAVGASISRHLLRTAFSVAAGLGIGSVLTLPALVYLLYNFGKEARPEATNG